MCPPPKRTLLQSLQPTMPNSFVEAVPSRAQCMFTVNRVLRDGTGTFQAESLARFSSGVPRPNPCGEFFDRIESQPFVQTHRTFIPRRHRE